MALGDFDHMMKIHAKEAAAQSMASQYFSPAQNVAAPSRWDDEMALNAPAIVPALPILAQAVEALLEAHKLLSDVASSVAGPRPPQPVADEKRTGSNSAADGIISGASTINDVARSIAEDAHRIRNRLFG